MDSNIKYIFDALKGQNINPGNENDFLSGIRTKEGADWAWNKLQGNANLGTKEEYYDAIGLPHPSRYDKPTDQIPKYQAPEQPLSPNETPLSKEDIKRMSGINNRFQNKTQDIVEYTDQQKQPIQLTTQINQEDPLLSKAKGVNIDPLYQTEGKEINRLATEMDSKQKINLQSDDLYKKLEEAKKSDTFDDVRTGVPEYMSVGTAGGTGTKAKIAEDSGAYRENWKYTAAEQLLNEASDIKNFEAKGFLKDAGGDFFKAIANPTTWDFGLIDTNVNGALLQTSNKFNNGDKLNQRDEMLLEAAAINTVTKGMYAYSRGAKAGKVVGENIPFMLEFILNPLSGSGSAIASATAKYAIKNLPRLMAKTIAKKALNIGARVAGDVAASAGMATTTGMMGVAADAERRMTGDIRTGFNDRGDVDAAGFNNQLQSGEAIVKAFGAKTIDNFSEMTGAYLGAAGKGVTSMIGKVAGNTRVGRVIGGFLNAPTVKAIRAVEKRAQWNGTFGEDAEEQMGTILNSIFIGDSKLSDLTNVDQQIDTFLGVGLTGGFMSTIHTVGYAADKAKAGIMLNTAGKRAEKAFGEDWTMIKKELQAIPIDQRKQYIKDMLISEVVPDNQKKVIMEYVGAQTFSDSLNMTEEDIKNYKRNERNNNLYTNTEDGKYLFEKSQQTPNSGTLFAINNKVNEYEARLGEEFASMSDEDIINYLDNTELPAEQSTDIENYLSIRSNLTGAIQAMNDKAQEEISQIHAEIDSTTREDGTRLVVTTPEVNREPSQTYYITDGDVALDDNGNVVRTASDTTLIGVNDKGETVELTINDINTASYQNAQEAKNKIADDIQNRYAQQFSQEAETNPIEVKKQEGAEIQWFENGKPHQGIVIDKADGVVRIQEGKKIVLKNELELNEQLKNPNVVYHLADKLPLTMDGQQYEGEITADADADGKYSVHVSSYPGKKNFELTAEEITALQTAPVADDKTSANEGKNATTSTGETKQNVREYPKNKKGEIDFDKMDIATTFDYLKETEGEDVALEGLNLSLTAVQKKIQENTKAVQDLEAKKQTEIKKATTIQEQAKIRSKQKETVERLTAERIELDKQKAEIQGLLPQVQAPVKTPTQAVKTPTEKPEAVKPKQAVNIPELSDEAKAANAAPKVPRVLTEEEVTNLHNQLVADVKSYNSIPRNHSKIRSQKFNELSKKSQALGYFMDYNGINLTILDKEKKPIRTFAQQTSKDEIDAHVLLPEYAPEFQQFATAIFSKQPEMLNFPNTNTEKAVRDIVAGLKSVAANRMLDQLEVMFTTNEVTIRATAATPEVVMSIQDYFAIFEPATKVEQQVLDTIPDEILNELLGDGEMTDEISNYLNDLYNETYNQINGRTETESTTDSVDRTQENGVSGQTEEPISPSDNGTEEQAEPGKSEVINLFELQNNTVEHSYPNQTGFEYRIENAGDVYREIAKGLNNGGFTDWNYVDRKIKSLVELADYGVNQADINLIQDYTFEKEYKQGMKEWLSKLIDLRKATEAISESNEKQILLQALDVQGNIALWLLDGGYNIKNVKDGIYKLRDLVNNNQQSEVTPSYSNGDTVTYKGKQYEINGIGKDEAGTVIYDLEQDGKTVFEDVMESELSKEEVKEQPLEKPKGITVISEEDNGKTLIYGTKTNQTRLSVKGYTADEIKDELDLEVSKQNRTLANLENDEKTLSKTPIGKDYEGLKKLISDNKKLIESAKVTIPWLEKKLKEAKDQPSPTQKQPWEMTAKERWDAERKRAIKSDGKAYVEKHMATLEEYKNGSHRQLVEKALSEGKQVPEEVLADYPEMKKEEVKPIGIDNQIEDVLFGETDEQKKSVSEKVDNVKKNIDRIVSINGKKVYDVSIDDENNIWYNFKKTGINANQKYYYPLQYAKIEYQAEVKPEDSIEKYISDTLNYFKKEIDSLMSKSEKAASTGDKERAQIYMNMAKDYMIDEKEFSDHVRSYPKYYMDSNIDPALRFKNRAINLAGVKPEVKNEIPVLTEEQSAMTKQARKSPSSVRELADMDAEDNNGYLSAGVLTTVEQGQSFRVGNNRTYTVTKKSKPNKVQYENEKFKGEYTRTSVTIKDDKGKTYSFEMWDDWTQNGKRMVSTILRKGYSRNSDPVAGLSRDIEGDITVDLINEYNQFHDKSDSYKILNKYILDVNRKLENSPIQPTPETPSKQSVKTLTPKVDTSTPKVDTSAKQPTLSREPKEVLQERKRLATEEKNRLTKLLSGKAIDMFREQSENELEAGTFDATQTNNRINELRSIEKELDAQIKLAEQAEKKGTEEAQGQQGISFEGEPEQEQPLSEEQKQLLYNNQTKVPEGKGNWREAFNKETNARKKADILRAVADVSKHEGELNDIYQAADGVVFETNNIKHAVELKRKYLSEQKPQEPKSIEDIAKEAVKNGDADQDEADQIERAEILDELTAGEIEQIDDFGEKIGGARKDMDITRTSREKDTMPAWRRKYYFTVPGNVMTLGEKVDTSKPFVVAYDIETSYHGRKSKSKKVVTDIKEGRNTYTPKVFTSEQEAEDYIPVFEVVRQGFKVRKGTDNYYIYKISSTGKVMEFDNFKTEAEATAYIASTEGSISLLNRKREDFSIPSLEKAERTGKDWRNGKNISTEELMSAFGFRGGEFGNWVKPEERRVFLNTTYDSFMDLAELLGISPKAISLGGNLAIAFGSRGSGGFDSASAHYEPGRAVINMTRLNGTGALAHEWSHALDNYFGLQDRKQDYTKDEDGKLIHSWSMLTEGKSFKGGMRGELLDLFMKITDYTTSKQVTQLVGAEENQHIFDKIQASVKDDADRLLLKLKNGVRRSKYNRKTKKYDEVVVKATEEQYNKVKELTDIIVTATGGEIKWQALSANTLGDWAYLSDEIREIETIYKSVFGSTGLKRNGNGYYNLTYYANKLKEAKQKLDDAKSGKTETVKVATDYYTNSKQFDKQKATPYWATKVELFARSFEGYINTLLQEKGVKSDYLQYDKAPVYKAVWGISPYAEGEELATMNEMWKEFFNTIQEGDNGAMFQSDKNSFTPTTLPKSKVLIKHLMKTGLVKDVQFVDEAFLDELEGATNRILRTKGNVKYGAIKDDIVYLNENLLNSNTPIHEFGHAYVDFIEKNYPELFARGAELVKETAYWKAVNKNKDYKDLSENARIKEAMAMAIGDNGESVVNDNGLKAKLKRWISDVWKRIGSAFGINNLTSEQISKLSFKDFVDIATSEVLSGENLTENELSNPFRRLDKAYEAKEYEQKQEISIREALADNDIPKPDDVWKDADTIFEPKRIVFNENNIGVSLYKHGIKGINSVHYYADDLLWFDRSEGIPGKTDGVPAIDRSKARMFSELMADEIDKYVGMLQQVKHLSTPAAQQSINELIEDARLSKDYYDRYAAGEDVWRTEKSPRFHIIGEQGAANLDKAEEATTRLDNLRVAKEMEKGKTEKQDVDILSSFNYRGTTVNKIENTFWTPGQTIGDYFNEDFIYVSNGFVNAVKEGLTPLETISVLDKNKKGEWHHLFTKNEDGSFDTKYVKFSEPKQYTPLEIRQATGWEKGTDLKWRYETAKHTIHHQLQEFLDKSPDGFSKWVTARLNNKLNVNLIDIFGKEDETLNALPQLKSIPVRIASDADLNGAAGDYDPETKSIRINVKVKADQDKIFSILEHEVQHAIQMIEGFARGGSLKPLTPGQIKVINADRKWYSDRIKEKEQDEKYVQLQNKLNDAYDKNDDELIDKIEDEITQYEDVLGMPVLFKRLNELNNKLSDKKGYQKYKRLAGEVEARNAATRKDYTPEERRQRLLSETADVSPEDQIIIMEGMGVSSSMTEDEVQDKADKIKKEGLKSIVPDYTKFLSDVLKDCPKRKDVVKQANELGWDLPKAIEDYMATFATKGTSKAEMERVTKLLGLEDFSKGEVKMILWENANPNDGTTEWKAKHAIAYNNAKDNSIPKFPTSAQIAEYEDSIGNLKLKGMEKDKNFVFRFEESYMNQLASVRKFMEIIEKLGDIPDKYNPYYLLQLRTSAAQTSLDRYEKKEYKTLMEAVSNLNKELKKANGLIYLNKDYKSEKGTIDRATLYSLAKAGLGRNERLAREEAAATYKEVYAALEAKYKEGLLEETEYNNKLVKIQEAEAKKAKKLNETNDYGGLTGLSDLVGSGAMDFLDVRKVVEDIVKEAEKTVDTKAFWDIVKKATSYSLKYQYDRGMMTKQMYEHVLNLEPYYLPLRGYDEETAADLYEYFTSNKGNFNPVLKKAKGHAHLPENPFAHLLSMTASGIMQAENNKVKIALLNLVENNKNDIISIKDTWIRNIGTEEEPEWVEAYPQIPIDATSEEVMKALDDFETKMQALKQEGRATIKSKNLRLTVPIGKGVKSEHAITVKRNGQEQTLYVNGNPRLAQAINGMLNPNTQDVSKFSKFIRSINRGMSANYTSRNLEFAASNTPRDMHMAVMLSAIEEGFGYSFNLMKNFSVCQRTLASSIFGTGTKGKYQDYLNEYLENGGQTGFVQLRSVEQYNKDVAKLQRAINKRDALAIPKWVFKQIGDINNMAEQITRFATYVTSREAGRTPIRSAVDAKNISLNFNQKGSGEMGAKVFQDNILFFNPSMQALYRFNQARQKNPARFWSVIGLHGASGFAVPLLTFAMMALVAGDDDDELARYQEAYWREKEWVRRNNLMIWIPGTTTFLKYPLGQSLRWAYSIGEIGFTKAKGREKYGDSTGKQIFESVTSLLPVDIFGASHGLIPGYATPIYESVVNENFMGNPFYKDVDKTMDQEDSNDPNWTKAYKNTWGSFVGISKKINELTGGDDITKGWVDKLPVEINNPAINQHLVEGYLGGFVSVYFRTGELIGKAISGKPVSVNEVPLVRRVVSVSDKQAYDNSTKREYYDIYNNLKNTVGHQVNRCNKIVNEYDARFNKGEETPTQEDLERWGLYLDKLNNLKQTKDYYRWLEAKEADKAMKSMEKKGTPYVEANVMKQAIDNIKAIDDGEAAKRVKAEAEAQGEEQVED